LTPFFISVLHQYGYPALWLIVFVAAVGAPISGNLLLYAGGAFAAFGDFNLVLLFFVGLSAAVLGDNLGYALGWKVGTPLFIWLEQQKRLRFISPQSVTRGRAYFRRRAGLAIFLSRFFILVLGGPINLLAGADRYPYRKFLFWDISGQVLGAILPLGIGYIFAASWGEASNISGAFSTFGLASLVATFLSVVVLRRFRSKRHEQTGEVQQAIQTETKPTILLLISRSGGGHLNLAQALQERLEGCYHVAIVDPQSGRVERFYTWASRHFVGFLNWQFTWTNNPLMAWGLQYYLALVGSKRFTHILEEIQPRLIITTHAMVSHAAARANEERPERVPLVFQLTDLERVHLTWFSVKDADAYLAPTREIFAQALRQGIDKERLHLTGRPIRRQFLETGQDEREATLTNLGFDPTLLTIFLQGGAQGSAGADRVITSIRATGLPIQIILATGHNSELLRRYAGTERIQVLPFTAEIAPYMAAADVIAGKAGASSISEAFLLEKPFLATAILAAQEGPGLRFIERYNLGWVCLEPKSQQELFTKLAKNPAMISDKLQSIQAYKAWNMQANQEINRVIDRLLSPGHEETINVPLKLVEEPQ